MMEAMSFSMRAKRSSLCCFSFLRLALIDLRLTLVAVHQARGQGRLVLDQQCDRFFQPIVTVLRRNLLCQANVHRDRESTRRTKEVYAQGDRPSKRAVAEVESPANPADNYGLAPSGSMTREASFLER